MTVRICPRCNRRYTISEGTGETDFVHECNSGSDVLDNEDVVKMGDWTDYTSVKMVSPIAYWKMNDNASDTTVVDSFGGINGVAERNTADISTPGKINRALSFNGIDDIITIPHHVNLNFGTGNVSISFWIKMSTTSRRYSPIAKHDAGWSGYWGVNYYATRDNISFYAGDVEVESNAVELEDDIWHHVVGVKDGTNIRIYIDGVFNNINTGETGNLDTSADICIGADYTHSYLNGSIDDLRIYNVALTPLEIELLYNEGNGTEEQNPLIPNKVNNANLQGSENKLFGTRADIEGEDLGESTRRGARGSTHRQRQHLEFIKLKGGD